MPKDITHIAIAEKVSDKLPEDSIFYRPIQKFLNVFIYAAVIPDAPFYYIIGPCSTAIQNSAKKFHTTDSSSLSPILEFLKLFPKDDPEALAFAAGVCCHIMTDTYFHPMVYYYAGMDGLHPGATARHRLFETALDYHFWPDLKDKQKISLSYIFNHLEIPEDRFMLFFSKLCRIENNPHSTYLKYGVKSHQILQAIFRNSFIYKIFRFLYDKKFIQNARHHALFYPYAGPVKIDFFSRPLEYRDPCQGTFHTESIDDLTQKTIEQILNLLHLIEKIKTLDQGICRVILDSDLPLIRPGLPQQKDKFKFWSGHGELEQDIYNNQ